MPNQPNPDGSDSDCYRSTIAWPEQLRSQVQASQASQPLTFTFAACSGATTVDVRAYQLDMITKRTDLVTMTIGGNDLGFSEVITTCLTVRMTRRDCFLVE